MEETCNVSGVWEGSTYTFSDGSSLELTADFSELLEALGKIIDTCDTFSTFSENKSMPLPMKVDALAHGIKDVRQALFETYTALGGEDHWECRDE